MSNYIESICLISIIGIILIVCIYCIGIVMLPPQDYEPIEQRPDDPMSNDPKFSDPKFSDLNANEHYQNIQNIQNNQNNRCYPIAEETTNHTRIIYGGELLDMERDIQDNYAWFVEFSGSPLIIPKLASELRFHIYTEDYVDAFDKVLIYIKGTQIQTNFIICKPVNKPHPDPNTFIFTVPLRSYPSLYEAEIVIIKAIARTNVDNILEVVFTEPTYSQPLPGSDTNIVIHTRCNFKTQTTNYGYPRRLYKIRLIIDPDYNVMFEADYYKTIVTYKLGDRESTVVEKQFQGNAFTTYPIIAFHGDPIELLRSLT